MMDDATYIWFSQVCWTAAILPFLFVSLLCKHVGYYHVVTLAAQKLPQLIYLLFVLHLSYSLYDH